MADVRTDICNIAIDYIGHAEISLFETDSNSSARACRRYYQDSVDEVLLTVKPQWAIKYTNATALSNYTPLSGWNTAFAYPSDCVDMLAFMPPEYLNASDGNWYYGYSPNTEFNRNTIGMSFELGNYNNDKIILCNRDAGLLVYVSNSVNSNSYDVTTRNAIAAVLATKIHNTLKGFDVKQLSNLMQIAKLKIGEMGDSQKNQHNDGSLRRKRLSGGYNRNTRS